jgi:hypothetical protein
MKARTLPLIRQRADGSWERIVIGSLAAGKARWEPYAWSQEAWEDKQRLAAQARLLGLPRPLEVAA